SRVANVRFETQHHPVPIRGHLLVIDSLLHGLLYRTSFASRVIVVPASACDTGQPALAASACLAKVAASMPGTAASQTRWLRDPEASILRQDRDMGGRIDVTGFESCTAQYERHRHCEAARMGRAEQFFRIR